MMKRQFQLIAFCFYFMLSSVGFAMDCPGPGQGQWNPEGWARYHVKYNDQIFLGRLISTHFKKMEGDFAIVATDYKVVEKIKGVLPNRFKADWAIWCDGCSRKSIMKFVDEYASKEGIITGHLEFGSPASKFIPNICFPFIALDRPLGQDLLPALKHEAAKQP